MQNDTRKTAQLSLKRNGIVEVRVIKKPKKGNKNIVASGYYDNIDALERAVDKFDQDGRVKGVYITLNKPKAEHIQNLNEPIRQTTPKLADKHIERYTLLLIDCDPEREKDTNSTAVELEAARLRCVAVVDALRNEFGFPEPIICMSGNGYHALYAVNLPVEDKPLIREFLKAISSRFSDDAVKIDTVVFNESRITKLYGTMTRKGPDTPDRPQRRSEIKSIPNKRVTVSREQLQSVIDKFGSLDKFMNLTSGPSAGSTIDIEAYCEKAGLEIMGTKDLDEGAIMYKLKECVFNSDHSPNEASIIVGADGVVRYQCFHDSCKDQTFKDVCQELDLWPDEWDTWELTMTTFPDNCDDAFPPEFLNCTRKCAVAHATDPEPLHGVACAIVGAIVGNQIMVEAKPGWQEPMIFWNADIRMSGAGKTPAANALCSPIWEYQKDLTERHFMALEEWKTPDKKDRGPEPSEPQGKVCSELTIEGLHADLDGKDGNGGVAAIHDEISGFFNAQNQYKGGNGSDRESWLKLFDGKPARVVRASGNRLIMGARVNICGGVQPSVWRGLFKGGGNIFCNDGTNFRFSLFVGDNEPFDLTDEAWNGLEKQYWDDLCERLRAFTEGGDKVVLVLTPEAWDHFKGWRNDLNRKKFSEQFKGFIPKAFSYALRYAGFLALLAPSTIENVTDEGRGVIDINMIKNGIKIAEFHLHHAAKAMALLSDSLHSQEPASQSISDKVIKYLADHNGASKREVYRGLHLTSGVINPVITDLINNDLIRLDDGKLYLS